MANLNTWEGPPQRLGQLLAAEAEVERLREAIAEARGWTARSGSFCAPRPAARAGSTDLTRSKKPRRLRQGVPTMVKYVTLRLPLNVAYMCTRCGVMVGDKAGHDEFHKDLAALRAEVLRIRNERTLHQDEVPLAAATTTEGV